MNFADRLVQASREKKSHVVVGLDPRWASLPQQLKDLVSVHNGVEPQAAALAYYQFSKDIIDAVADIAVAVKPQFAFYEQFGPWGMHSLVQTVTYAKSKGLLVIGDGKRSDIGSTAEAYAAACLGAPVTEGEPNWSMGLDALTVNAYLGTDGVKPFLKSAAHSDAGVFVLVKTSNPSSGELQDKQIEGRPVYHLMAEMTNQWGEALIGQFGYSSVGAVVGATYPEESAELRQLMPKAYFLVPGYGAQGGTAADVVSAFNHDGLGAVVNSSRGVIFAYQKMPEYGAAKYANAARAAAEAMRIDINQALQTAGKLAW